MTPDKSMRDLTEITQIRIDGNSGLAKVTELPFIFEIQCEETKINVGTLEELRTEKSINGFKVR